MKFYKIAALMYADFMLLRNSKLRVVEYFYFPFTTVLIWGLFSVFVRAYALEAGLMVLAVNILWTFAYLAQSHANMQINEDSWSGSLKQIIITGVSDMEYITARILSAMIISLFVLALLLVFSSTVFGLTVVAAQWPVFVVLIGATLLSSIGLSIFVAGAMVALGREYGFLAWTILQIFIVLSAPFYSIDVFPEIMRPVVLAMPFTHVFAATREIVMGTLSTWTVVASVVSGVVYFLASLPFYIYIFRRARQKGWLVRLS